VIDSGGVAKRTAEGRLEYIRLFSFDSRAVADAFSTAVIAALLARDAKAIDREGV
jgi:hypothetical protein